MVNYLCPNGSLLTNIYLITDPGLVKQAIFQMTLAMRDATSLPWQAVRAAWASSMHKVEDGTLTWANSTQWTINRLSASQIALAQPKTSTVNSSSKRPCKYYNDALCSHEGKHGPYPHICAYCYKQRKQFAHPENKYDAKQRQTNKSQQSNSYDLLRPLEPRIQENSQRHNSNLNDFRKLVLSRKYVKSFSNNLVVSDCSNVYMYNGSSVDSNQHDGKLYDVYDCQYTSDLNCVNNCEMTHKSHDDYGEADTSVYADRYTISLSTVDILNSCFHDTLDNSINYLVLIHDNGQRMFKGFYFLKVHCLTSYMTLINCLRQLFNYIFRVV